MRRIGFIGIGNMGAPMVRCLSSTFPVLIYDVRGDATQPFQKAGAAIRIASSLAEVGKECRTIITMLPDSRAVRAAVLGEATASGFAANLEPGATVIDMSSSFPLDTRQLGEELGARKIELIDAPVSGGVPKATAGTLAIMAGGSPAVIDAVENVLATMGTVHRTGPLGSGHAMKALNNYVSAAGLIAACEALIIGERFGLDGHVMTSVFNASTGRNNTTENKLERYMLNGAFNSGFALSLMEKDVGMARTLAATLGVRADQLNIAEAILNQASAALGPTADHTAVFAHVTKLSP
jgi:3-hydroxyisobutyrate dehydrogenase